MRLYNEEGYTGEETLYTYDDKKSPFYHCQTPKWCLRWFLGYEYSSENNIKTATWDNGYSVTFEYTNYNEEGFPVTRTVGSSTTTYTYMKK